MTDAPEARPEGDGPDPPLKQELDVVAHVSRRHAWLTRIGILALALVAGYLVVQFVGSIDWSAVADALDRLVWWQLVVLLVPLMVRQILNAFPLAVFIRGLGLVKALVNDLAAHLLAVVAPPPGDMVIRVRMFTSWGIEASRAIAGTLMNMLAFYIMRFAVPVVGVLILLPVRYDAEYAVTAAFGAAISGAIAVLLALSLRHEGFAERVGRTSGTWVSKVKSDVDPGLWASAVVEFRGDVKETFSADFPRSAFALLCLVFADATVLLTSLRFVGVSSAELSAIEVYAAFLCAYPFTVFPFMGLGIVDAILLATIVDVAGAQAEPAAVAGLIVWRTYTLGGPITLGALCMALWRRSVRPRPLSPAPL
jgi:putative heme transporter